MFVCINVAFCVEKFLKFNITSISSLFVFYYDVCTCKLC